MDRPAHYLRIPEHYGAALGGLRWSDQHDAIMYRDAGTFALAPELGLFLEGFASTRPLIHFGFALHLLHLLGYGKLTPPTEFLSLWKGFRRVGRPLFNAGVLCAELCDEIPAEPSRLQVSELRVCLGLSAAELPYPSWVVSPFGIEASEPPLSSFEFEKRVRTALARFHDKELEHWFRYGCAPVGDAGDQLARQLTLDPNRRLESVLAFVAQQPRLAGALAFVPQLLSALALPPRRLAEQELAVGGYADIATRGDPERILPSQFAMDEMEFVRRFAQNELLYFRREEPPAQAREELVVVLDQGVRTWGIVRLILSAATLALGKLATKKKLPFLLAATSSDADTLDPAQADSGELAEVLQASDLSANPGLALERVLEQRIARARDVVLLTHPRSVSEPDVNAAARLADRDTRLFALSVNDHGNAQFCQLKHGVPVVLSQFQVVFPKEEPPAAGFDKRRRARNEARSTKWQALPPWTADVEPVGYPFPLGLSAPVKRDGLAFDADNEWLLALTVNGMLHLSKLDGSWSEVLPRARFGEGLLDDPKAILGVAGGFVVIGHSNGHLLVGHYDLLARQCKAYPPSRQISEHSSYFYFREHHTVVVVHFSQSVMRQARLFGSEQRSEFRRCALDLATGEWAEPPQMPLYLSRAERALEEVLKWTYPPPHLPIDLGEHRANVGPWASLEKETGTLTLHNVNPPWRPCVPLADGKPLLKDCLPSEAQYSNGMLALTYCRTANPNHFTLSLLRGPEGLPVCEYPSRAGRAAFLLSQNASLLARHLTGTHVVQVHDLTRAGAVDFCTPQDKIHSNLKVEIGLFWLTVQIGKLIHLLRWDNGPLVLQRSYLDKQQILKSAFGNRTGMTGHEATNLHRARGPCGDPMRFVVAAEAALTVLVDRFGQIAVLEEAGTLICMFRFSREMVAAWMPDGTRYGPPLLSGGPAAPDALQKLGTALHRAEEVAELRLLKRRKR
jgi:MoxR-vWA-beta-propeller ternary system domain bpX1